VPDVKDDWSPLAIIGVIDSSNRLELDSCQRVLEVRLLLGDYGYPLVYISLRLQTCM
jgi:hypothetical protein